MSDDLPSIRPPTQERTRVLLANPARKCLLDQMTVATSYEAIGTALQAQLSWLRANPDDFGVLQAGEGLMYAFESLCLRLLMAMRYESLPPGADPGEESLMRSPGGAADERLAVHIIWTYPPAGVDALHTLIETMRLLRATDGLLITGAGLTAEAMAAAQRRGIRVIAGEALEGLLRTYLPDSSERKDEAASSVAALPRRGQ